MSGDLSATNLVRRIEQLPWADLSTQLNERGFASISNLLTVDECRFMDALYDQPALFRKRVVMGA